MPDAIKTSGELREFLAQSMESVRSGELAIDRASQITKLAAQINESFYSEIKIARTSSEAGRKVAELGRLPIKEWRAS